jgi:hypothetical protein
LPNRTESNILLSPIMSKEDDLTTTTTLNPTASQTLAPKITLDSIAYYLLKHNFILTALELHTELAESSRELPRLRDFFSNPANFEQQTGFSAAVSNSSQNASNSNNSSAGFYPLHKASSIQTFDSLDLTRYSDDADQTKFQDDKIAVLEFELRKAKETINQLRNTLTTLATESNNNNSQSKSSVNIQGPIEKLNDLKIEQNQGEEDVVFGLESQIDEPAAPQTSSDVAKSTASNQLMPHDKHAINFLINEYLLENSYKMTSITFSEENESQDLEDWDVVGLNRCKPPNLLKLYKLYLNRKEIDQANLAAAAAVAAASVLVAKSDAQSQTAEPVLMQSAETNTNVIERREVESFVNFDRDTFENQRIQINKLLEKQEILLKSLSKLETEIGSLNSERESSLKKIDLL